MLCTRDDNLINEEEANEMIEKLNTYVHELASCNFKVQAYLEQLFKCVNAGAIRFLQFNDKTYEINVDILEG